MPPPLPDFERILVRATNWVGDAVMSLPALQQLRLRYPKAHIAVLARPWVADLYEREPFADEVILLDSARGARDWSGKWRVAQRLRAARFDAAILLQNAFEAALITWLAGIPRRIGYNRDGRGLLLTDAIAVPRPGEIPRHERYQYLELLRRAGIVNSPLADAPIEFARAAETRAVGHTAIAARGFTHPVIGLSPGAAFGTAKRWAADRFAEAAVQLARQMDASVAVFGSQDERTLCEEVRAKIESQGIAAQNFAGATSLREFIELAAGCTLYLTNDSGAMHVAYALGIPTVAVFGSTDEFGTGPAGPKSVVVRENVDCSPCQLRVCPVDHRCMKRVTVDRVVTAGLELMR